MRVGERSRTLSILPLVLFLVAFVSLAGLPAGAAPMEEEWSRTYGGPWLDGGTGVLQTSGAGYILAGTTRSAESVVSTDGIILATDRFGIEQWRVTLGGPYYDGFDAIQPAAGGGYVLLGDTLSLGHIGNGDIWLVKVDGSGAEVWSRTLGGEGYDGGDDLAIAHDGGYIIAAATGSEELGGGPVALVRTSEGGDPLWIRSFGTPGTADRVSRVKQTSDGGYILAGVALSLNDPPLERAGWLIRMDGSGNELWSQRYGHNRINLFSDVQETSDGGFIAVGFTDPYPSPGQTGIFLVKTDPSGIIEWETILGGWSGEAVHQTPDGGYLIAGTCKVTEACVLKADSTGSYEWEREFGLSPNSHFIALEPTFDGGYAMAGTLEQPGNNWDLFLVKIVPVLISPFPGLSNPPTDPDGDGLYEDTNGNGIMDYDDAVVLFWNIQWIQNNEPVSAFDFNGNGIMDYDDAVTLFWQI